MTTLGQWFFEKEKAAIMARVRERTPYTAKVNAVNTSAGRVSIVDPFTGAAELEELPVIGMMPALNSIVLVVPLVDGGRVALSITAEIPLLATPANGNTDGIQIGRGSSTVDRGSAIGVNAQAADASTAVGSYVVATGYMGTALGWAAEATAQGAVAAGYTAKATALNSIAIGWMPVVNAISIDAIALGSFARATGDRSIAIGYETQATDGGSIAIGNVAQTTAYGAIAIGTQTRAASLCAAIGWGAAASGVLTTALGHNTIANAEWSMALGIAAQASYPRSIALGTFSTATAADQFRVRANELALDRSLGTGATTLVLRSPNGTWKRLTITDANTVSITNA